MATNTIGQSTIQPSALRSEKAGKAGKTPDRGPETPSDALKEKSGFNVELSSRARELADARNKALEIARNAPDIREDRVAELKQKINAGTYQIDANKVADGLYREAVLDKLAELPDGQ